MVSINSTGVFAGHVVARFGCRLPSMCGTLVCTSGLLATAFAPDVTWLFISFGLVTGERQVMMTHGRCLSVLPHRSGSWFRWTSSDHLRSILLQQATPVRARLFNGRSRTWNSVWNASASVFDQHSGLARNGHPSCRSNTHTHKYNATANT